MKIPLSQYQLAHIRKAVFAGVGMAVTAFVTGLTSGVQLQVLVTWPAVAGLLSAFLIGLLGTFRIPNKDFMLVEKVIETINPVLGEKVAVILDPMMAAREPTDRPVVEQVTPAPLVMPGPDPLTLTAQAPPPVPTD